MSLDALVQHFTAARDRGDGAEAARLWREVGARALPRLLQSVRAFRHPDDRRRVARDDAEDVAMDAYERLARATFKEGPASFAAFLRGVVRNTCLDHLRYRAAREKHQTESLDAPAGPDADPGTAHQHDVAVLGERAAADAEAGREAADRVERALAQLPPEQGTAVRMRRDGHTYEEIAAKLATSTANAYQLHSRGTRRLAEILRSDDG